MLDKTGRDQFVVKHGDEVVILWNDGRRCRADEAYKRAFWTGGKGKRVCVCDTNLYIYKGRNSNTEGVGACMLCVCGRGGRG
jgi:hypothetical protein